MEKKRTYNTVVLYIMLTIAMLLFVGVIARILYRYSKHNSISDIDEVKSYSTGWKLTDEYAEILGFKSVEIPYTIDNVKEYGIDQITIEKIVIDGHYIDKSSMYFVNTGRNSVSVTVNDDEVFNLNDAGDKAGLSIKGRFIVNLPADIKGKCTIRITMGAYDGKIVIPELFIGSRYAVTLKMLSQDTFTLIVIWVLFIIGIVILFFAIYSGRKKVTDVRLVLIAISLIMAALWGFADSTIGLILGINAYALGYLSYISFMLLIAGPVVFVWSTLKRKSRILFIDIVVILLNEIFEVGFTLLGFCRLQNLLIINHFIIVISLIICIAELLKKLKEEKSKSLSVIFRSYVIVLVTAFLAVFAFWQYGSTVYRAIMMIGILFFIIGLMQAILLGYIEKNTSRKYRIQELEIYERLSNVDSLTGIGNRRAFEEKIKDIEKRYDEIDDAVLVMMDLNGLKYTNDMYGHIAGDDLIIAASKVINDAYGEYGDTYRIGGDEFAAIIEKSDVDSNLIRENFYKKVEEYCEKSDKKLAIAAGDSHLRNSNGRKIEISDWKQEADINMYKEKKRQSHKREGDDDIQEFRDIIDCMISLEEAKDSYTAYHSDRVCAISILIAKKLGLSEKTIKLIKDAALLHDIGKIGISDSILTKPGKLTDEEYATMKQHSSIGYQILSKSENFAEVAQVVLHHHERYDGKGYPERISGETIPIGARVIAIGDSIDAMTSKRCYRNPLSLDYCFNEVKNNLGKMYDPAIGEIALENWNEIENIILANPKRLEDMNKGV